MFSEVHKRRLALGITQVQLAELVGVGQPTIVNYDRGKGWPEKPSVRARLETVLGAPIETLLAPENKSGPNTQGARASESKPPTENGVNSRAYTE